MRMRMSRMKMSDSPNSDYSELELDGGGKEDEQGKPEEEVRIPSPPSAAVYPSVCTFSMAEKCAVDYKVPPEYGLCCPRAEHRAHAPPPGYAAIYIHHFRHGLRLPLPPFVLSLLDYYQIALAQLHPICIFPILGFMEICNKISVAPTVALFRHFFRLQNNCQQTVGWYTLYAIPPRIVYGYPHSVNNWKSYFLFFKTENATLSWNHSLVVEMPVAENERPSEPTVSKFLANVKRFDRLRQCKRACVTHSAEERMIEADSSMASLPKSCKSKKRAKKSSEENEPTLTPCATVKSKIVSTASPSAVCRVKKMSEFHAAKLGQTPRELTGKKCVDGSSQVPPVQSLKEFGREIQERLCSFSLQLQGEKEKLEKVVVTLEQDMKDKDSEISSLQGEKEEFLKVLDSLKTDVSRLQGSKEQNHKLQGYNEELKNKNGSLRAEVSRLLSVSDDPGPILRVLEKAMVTMEQEAKDKNEEIGSLKSQLKSVVDDRGPLLKVYTHKLLESQAFGRLFYDLTTSAQRLGRHEAAEQIQDHFPAIPEDALVGLQDPLAAVQLENLFCDMVQDDAFKFPLLDHLLSLPEIPSSSQLKHLEVDDDQNWMIDA